MQARELVDVKNLQDAEGEQPVQVEQAVNNVADLPMAVPAAQAVNNIADAPMAAQGELDVNNVADAPLAAQAEPAANDVVDAPMAVPAEQAVNDVADAPMAIQAEQAVNNNADAPMAVQAEQAVNNVAHAPMAGGLPYDDSAVLCLAGHNGECVGVFCHKLDVDRATALLTEYFCRQCALNVLGRLADWWWTDIRTNHRDTLPGECFSATYCSSRSRLTYLRSIDYAMIREHSKFARLPVSCQIPCGSCVTPFGQTSGLSLTLPFRNCTGTGPCVPPTSATLLTQQILITSARRSLRTSRRTLRLQPLDSLNRSRGLATDLLARGLLCPLKPSSKPSTVLLGRRLLKREF